MARLIWLMGASGAGKDSLLQALRAQTPPALLIAHRYITRSADAGGENHIALSSQEFQRRCAAGLFAVHWQAHDQHYGLGIEIDLWLERGLDVLVNGSRLHLAAPAARYGARMLPICLTVSLPQLEQRLRRRGREDEQQIAVRLARAAAPAPEGCHSLSNDGPLSETLAAFNRLLEQMR
ncbi:ribose 1,5-bisphosphate phosphokinase PhnN [Izhakiella australiensis]|uniref:Ribose 1,5-bisphosphate phosphokinase PhnN n=1 Tax=Izhakiella australiensis TaxID=1926881 RepID=A0A1S8YL81_9GAMM|nr:ribose 1,5-bisphosphokinase [Izhakiella australiensis]OON39794.1 ribose 1,5-bisphosphate phosphokinase PhnN [Izhakiella australiensis]